jgi:hypothetical protein
MSRILNLLICLLGKPRKSSSSISGRSFLCYWTSITGFTEDSAQDTAHIAYNTIIFVPDGIMLLSSSARVLRRSAQLHCFMDAITLWSMGCIIAVTLGGAIALQRWGHHQKSVFSVLDERGHCLAATLLSVVILCLSEKPNILEQNACGTNFKKSPYPSMLLSGFNNGQECSLPL